MNRFVDVVPLAMTPLTPIHIGCGEDFEPTNYVIDGGVLYHFEPSRLALAPADRRRLADCANERADAAIRAIQRFFHAKRAECREASRLAVPVAAGVAEWYEDRVGHVSQRESRGRTVSNQLEIERTAHHPHTGTPYLPGSSLKGSMRTGWLNNLDSGRPVALDRARGPSEKSDEVERRLLDGSFATDPFRLVNLADASNPTLQSRVVFAVDRSKRPRESGREKHLFVRREAIGAGQLRGLQGEVRFRSVPDWAEPPHVPGTGKRITDFPTVARACNRFYLKRVEAELAILRRFCSGAWIDAFDRLVHALRPALEEGRAMLLRVGRHSGAESVTLDGFRWIRIMEGRGQYHWAQESTTVWLAAEHEDSTTELQPFGWLLVEAETDHRPTDDLERWCEFQAKTFDKPKAQPAAIPASETPQESVTVWRHAQLQYDHRNGTLAAIGPDRARANAFAERAQQLLSGLPEEVRRKVLANQFVRVTARIRHHELVNVEITT
jgi:CRISPR-associated protein Csm5